MPAYIADDVVTAVNQLSLPRYGLGNYQDAASPQATDT